MLINANIIVKEGVTHKKETFQPNSAQFLLLFGLFAVTHRLYTHTEGLKMAAGLL